MKARRLIYIILGSALILLNLVIDFFIGIPEDDSPSYDDSETVAYFIGTQLFIVIGLVFLLMAFSVTRKIKRKNQHSLKTAIDEIGSSM